MELVFTIVNYLVLVVAIAIPVLALTHWFRPWSQAPQVINKLGLIIALCGVLQTLSFASLLFANWYSEVRYSQQFFGTWYSSTDYPWIIYTTAIPFILIYLAFWCKPVRKRHLVASIFCLLLLLPSIHDLCFPTELPPLQTL